MTAAAAPIGPNAQGDLEQIDISPDDGTIGPAVTPGFTEATGFDDLLGNKIRGDGAGRGATRKGEDTAAPTATRVSPVVVLPEGFVQKQIELLDMVASRLLNVEPEEPVDLQRIAEGMTPLAAFYASQTESKALMWYCFIASLGSFVALKAQKMADLEPEERSDLFTPEGVDNGGQKENDS